MTLRETKKVPTRPTCTTSMKACGGYSWVGAFGPTMAALFTSTSMRAEAGHDLGRGGLHRREIADVHGLKHHAGGVHPVREGPRAALASRSQIATLRARGEHPFGHGEPDALAARR